MREIKGKHGFLNADGSPKELKYNHCYNAKTLGVAKECVDAFFESTSYFRLIAIEQGADWFDMNRFGFPSDDKKMKMAKMYKKFTELLLAHNTVNAFNVTLMTDELTRCDGDIFFALMENLFCTPGLHYSENKKEPTIKPPIREVHSDLEQYQVLQITDLLMGCVLNSLKPTKNPYKTEISEYLSNKV